jgi:hypothetical protein
MTRGKMRTVGLILEEEHNYVHIWTMFPVLSVDLICYLQSLFYCIISFLELSFSACLYLALLPVVKHE